MSRAQLIERGVDGKAIDRRLASGRLLLERPGVYRAAGAPVGDRRARCVVALLDCGQGSIVSGYAAAAEWRMRLPAPRIVDITSPRQLRSRPGIRVHRRVIHPAEIRSVDGIPFTSPAQTVFDLAATLDLTSLRKIANQGFVERRSEGPRSGEKVLTIYALRTVATRNERRKGARRFALLLNRLDPHGRRVDSPLEVRLNDFLRERGFPPWESNVDLWVGGERRRPDVLWRSQCVIVEADGRDPHSAPDTFDADRRKDRRARVEGWEPVRVTSADLNHRRDELDADLRALLRI